MRASKPGSTAGALTACILTRCAAGPAAAQISAQVGAVSASADRAQPQVRVVLERLEDRALGLRERARRRVRRLGQRPAERLDHEVVRLLVERERARLARRADDAARPRRRSRRGARASPQPAQAASCGAKPAASSSLSRKASALARVARAGSASSSASWLASRW